MPKKKAGKINITHINKAFKNRDVPRLISRESNKYNKNDIENAIEKMIDEINDKYTYEMCLLIVGTPEDIPESLYELLKGSGINGLACWNLDFSYLEYKRRKYDAYEFMCTVDLLLSALIGEFDKLIDFFLIGNIDRKENSYERS